MWIQTICNLRPLMVSFLSRILRSFFVFQQNIISPILNSNKCEIGNSAFYGRSQFQSFDVEPNNLNYRSIDGILFSKNLEMFVCFPSRHSFSTYTIPTNVSSIGDSALSDCSKLQSLIIPASVISIGDYAFSMCSNLRSIPILLLKSW